MTSTVCQQHSDKMFEQLVLLEILGLTEKRGLIFVFVFVSMRCNVEV